MEYKYKELTHTVIGCAMQVHRTLGAGFPEAVYQRSLALELEAVGVLFQREIVMPLFYRGKEVGARRTDFLVEGILLVELKAVSEIVPLHHQQIINYLKAYQLNVGLLINFGEASLRFKRFIQSSLSE
ncbi:GxxExxY protein [Hymenobacter weizhouensis]|uniref:GxxExxY protein n=1 Tax=Hymenobacter sp. YIM 151500-1 TaxID=2987689 RepID=UPI002227DB0F|nr:GxxExxY protein [Hymenobacter sp. YIM 151500-1]UYZ62208.1 GxxExxY protein [Hymenobacter sp. YIM 151500-1]